MPILIFSYIHTSKFNPDLSGMLALIRLSEAGALVQKRDQSIPERIIRAVNHCRTALMAGYTTYR